MQYLLGGLSIRSIISADDPDKQMNQRGALPPRTAAIRDVPAEGTVIEGAASVSEAAAPVLRRAAPQLSLVRCGTHVLSDWLVVRVRSRSARELARVWNQRPLNR